LFVKQNIQGKERVLNNGFQEKDRSNRQWREIGPKNELNSLSERALKGLEKDVLPGRSPVAEDR
jgi:hypothetical protein